jgi:hypothetical protein
VQPTDGTVDLSDIYSSMSFQTNRNLQLGGPRVFRAFPRETESIWASGGFSKSRSMEVGRWGQSVTEQWSE